MEKKRIRRRRCVIWDGRLTGVVIKCVMFGVTFYLWAWTLITVVFRPSETTKRFSDVVPRPRAGRVWIPYQLSLSEVSTGKLSQESIYTGTYQYKMIKNVDLDPVSDRKHSQYINRSFRIHFPMEIDTNEQMDTIDQEFESSSTCLWTHTGAKGYEVPNQDRSVVIADQSIDNRENSWSLAALFDGHGDFGHVTSHVAVTDLPSRILQSVFTESNSKIDSLASLSTTNISNLMKGAFQKIDTTGVISQLPQGGSTAVVVLQLDNWVHIASVGDSTAVLVQWFNKVKPPGDRQQSNDGPPYRIIASAVKHKPGDPLERNRIEASGGKVYIPRNPNESSRVIFDVLLEDGSKAQTGLAMSRSLGDTPAKEQNVVIADPDVLSIDLGVYRSTSSKVKNSESNSMDHFFVILASDGVTDMISLNDIIKQGGSVLYNHYARDGIKKKSTLGNTCRMVVNNAAKAWNKATNNQYRDDISLVILKIM